MKEIQLSKPSEFELDDAYRQLSKGGNVLIETDTRSLSSILNKMEEIGFVGIEIPYFLLEKKFISVIGFKGKHGPCFNTGLSAAYIGSALAAFDDDNHLLTKGKHSAVCEKTGIVYKFPPYRGLIEIIEGNWTREGKDNAMPEKFSLYSLDDELNALYSLLKDRLQEKERITAFYPGPFKTLILSDGSIIKRGEVNSLPASLFKNLLKTDRFIELKTEREIRPVLFQDEYERYGPGCLQLDQKIIVPDTTVHEIDIGDIDFQKMKLTSRLKELIDRDRRYFILTGSDPADEMGCCPSDEVSEANRLVEAGILSAVSQEVYGDSCPVSFYAFRDEIFMQDGDIQFNKNENLRKEVGRRLKGSGIQVYKMVIRWILLGFVGISLVFAFLKVLDNFGLDKHSSLYEQLSIDPDNAIVVLLFHNRVRCEMCLNMERHIDALLQDEYPELINNKELLFFLIDMNDPAIKIHTDRFQLYTASVVIVKMVDREEKQIVVLDDIWKDHNNEIVFKRRIRNALGILLSKKI